MEWYFWVIIGLVGVIGLLIVGFLLMVRATGKAFAELVVKPWAEGNFGKRKR